MGTTYQITEVAERTGFTPATLRYYEDIGLMTPAGRTEAGYRLYDDTSLERLRFINRAKQLGCTLEEITDLASVWDGGECAPVQERLRATVDAKIVEAQARIVELTTFTADLQGAAEALHGHRPDGPCDDTCGCATDTPTRTAGGSQTSDSHAAERPPTEKPEPFAGKTGEAGTNRFATASQPATLPDAPPIACALDADQVTSRLDEWSSLLEGVSARLFLDDGVRLELGPGTDVAEVARLAAAEQGCCRFFRFDLVVDQRGIALEVHAPPEAADAVTALFGATR